MTGTGSGEEMRSSPERLSPRVATRGMVATAHPLASATALNILQQGGNAIDSAIAAAAVLGVVQPMMSGLGGDTFILYYDATRGRLRALNGSGAAPRMATVEYYAARGYNNMPLRGILSVSVPGAVDAMSTALELWGTGRFTLPALLAPAIEFAKHGVGLTPAVAEWMQVFEELFRQFPTLARIFAPAGKPLGAGEILLQPDLAASLKLIASEGRDAFYRGPLAEAIDRFSRSRGGILSLEDLREHRSEIVEPISISYRGHTMYTTPPPSQGAVLLIMLAILRGFPREVLRWGDPKGIHLAVEAKKRAFADRWRYLGDPRTVASVLEQLLSEENAARHREEILRGFHLGPDHDLRSDDTTYFCVGDRRGNLVSYISSLSAGFGAGEVVEGTGIVLNNRAGRGFTLEHGHPNCLAPGKRTMNTLMPVMASDEAGRRYVFGTPGGDGQPQWSLQVFLNFVESGMNPQEAVEAARWQSFPGSDPATIGNPFEIRLEEGFPNGVTEALRTLGHKVVPMQVRERGGVQMILSDERGFLGGSDPRVGGNVVGY